MSKPVLAIMPVDPRSPEASELIGELSEEIARRYDFIADGSGLFKAEDTLVERSAFVIGYAEGRAVACGALRPLEDTVAEIKRMYVKPQYRGHGYARAILAELERLAWEHGYSRIRLETGSRQHEAISLYERSGYARIPLFGIYLKSGWSEWSVCFEKQKPEPMCTLRRYTPADQPAVEYLHVHVLQQTGAYLGRGPWDDDINTIEATYLNNHGEFLIGEWNGILVAMGALHHTTPQRAAIKRMRVHPDYQGRGLGQLILSELEARARALGYTTLHLDTSILQIPAQKLYEKNGFHEVGRARYQDLEVILYEKQLEEQNHLTSQD